MKNSLETEKSVTKPVPRYFPETADLIISCLEQIGVEYVFGVPGGAIEPFYNALARSQRRGRIFPVIARHESGAVFMADGYARDSGRLAVCCTTTGPGVTNAITGVASAYQDEIPMLVITAQTPLESFGRGAVQESSCTGIDTVAMLSHCTHYNTLVSHPGQLERKLGAAISMAIQARGPVHLSIPLDILRAPCETNTPLDQYTALFRPVRAVDPDSLDALYTRVCAASRIVVIVGEGCREHAPSVVEFAERTGAVLVTTPQGKGLVDPYHAHYRGVCGLAGHRRSRELLLHPGVELVLVVGSVLDDQAGQGWLHEPALRGKLVHVDALARHFTRSQHASLHVCGDVGRIFSILNVRVGNDASPAWDGALQASSPAPNIVPFERRRGDRRHGSETASVSERRHGDRRMASMGPRLRRAFALNDEHKCAGDDDSAIKPQRLMHELSRIMPAGTRFLADIGNSFLWGIHYLQPAQDDSCGSIDYFRTSMGFASMGWSIGAAVGTAISDSSTPVVCLVGDGSFLMSGQEITTAIMCEAPVIFVVLNDQALGTVKHGQRLAGAERIGFELPQIDFAGMAQAMGVAAYRVATVSELRDIDFSRLARRRGPSLIDVRIDDSEAPPLSERLDMLATSS
ncbi:MAG: thiamine pyrophosphate-binding protein [Gammaproteobacteria bacterium]|jgi:acetolactate synthase-1/2/3 large subunit|nr:thiamine pyrophosphate-binding protein [Gammaproteobacteria bacterium]